MLLHTFSFKPGMTRLIVMLRVEKPFYTLYIVYLGDVPAGDIPAKNTVYLHTVYTWFWPTLVVSYPPIVHPRQVRKLVSKLAEKVKVSQQQGLFVRPNSLDLTSSEGPGHKLSLRSPELQPGFSPSMHQLLAKDNGRHAPQVTWLKCCTSCLLLNIQAFKNGRYGL